MRFDWKLKDEVCSCQKAFQRIEKFESNFPPIRDRSFDFQRIEVQKSTKFVFSLQPQSPDSSLITATPKIPESNLQSPFVLVNESKAKSYCVRVKVN
jgi:hypothetical protein